MTSQLRCGPLRHALDGVKLGVFLDRRGDEAIGRNARSVARGMDDGEMKIVGDADLAIRPLAPRRRRAA